MDQFVLILFSFYQSKAHFQKNKEEVVPKDFDSIYSAANVRLKTSNNKHLNDSI